MFVARDLIRVPTLLSLARLPLGVAFLAVADRPAWALAVIGLSGATDVLDGWIARRTDQVTVTGAIVDPLTDKWFVACVLVALVTRGALSPLGAGLLLTRELVELPLAFREWRRKHDHLRYVENPMALRAGKFATVLQFATIGAAVTGLASARDLLLAATAFSGALAGLAYWKRTLLIEGTSGPGGLPTVGLRR